MKKWLGIIIGIVVGMAFWALQHRVPNPPPVEPLPLPTPQPPVTPPPAPKPAPVPPVVAKAKPTQTPRPPAPKPKTTTPPRAAAPRVTPATATPVPAATPYTPPPALSLPPPPPAPRAWHGNDTEVKHSGQIVIRNERQWISFWSEHHPHEVSPDVDFTRDMVIGVFLGERPADAFAVEMVNIREESGTLWVDYVERNPPPGTFAVGVSVYPYQIKVIPKTNAKVKFKPVRPGP